jgi:hypothetical protein
MKQSRSRWNDDRLDAFEARMDERFDRFEKDVDQRFDRFEGRVENRFNSIDTALHQIQRSMFIGLASFLAAFAGLVVAVRF